MKTSTLPVQHLVTLVQLLRGDKEQLILVLLLEDHGSNISSLSHRGWPQVPDPVGLFRIDRVQVQSWPVRSNDLSIEMPRNDTLKHHPPICQTCHKCFMSKSSGTSFSRMASPITGPNWVSLLIAVLATTLRPCVGSSSWSRRLEGKLSWANDFDRSRPSGGRLLLFNLKIKGNQKVQSIPFLAVYLLPLQRSDFLPEKSMMESVTTKSGLAKGQVTSPAACLRSQWRHQFGESREILNLLMISVVGPFWGSSFCTAPLAGVFRQS